MDHESVAFSLNYFGIENPFRDAAYKYYLLIEGSSCSTADVLNE